MQCKSVAGNMEASGLDGVECGLPGHQVCYLACDSCYQIICSIWYVWVWNRGIPSMKPTMCRMRSCPHWQGVCHPSKWNNHYDGPHRMEISYLPVIAPHKWVSISTQEVVSGMNLKPGIPCLEAIVCRSCMCPYRIVISHWAHEILRVADDWCAGCSLPVD